MKHTFFSLTESAPIILFLRFLIFFLGLLQ